MTNQTQRWRGLQRDTATRRGAGTHRDILRHTWTQLESDTENVTRTQGKTTHAHTQAHVVPSASVGLHETPHTRIGVPSEGVCALPATAHLSSPVCLQNATCSRRSVFEVEDQQRVHLYITNVRHTAGPCLSLLALTSWAIEGGRNGAVHLPHERIIGKRPSSTGQHTMLLLWRAS